MGALRVRMALTHPDTSNARDKKKDINVKDRLVLVIFLHQPISILLLFPIHSQIYRDKRKYIGAC